MKFGAFLWQRRGEDLAANARLAEQLGFESVWMGEHLGFPIQFKSTYPYDESGIPPVHNDTAIHDPLIDLYWKGAATWVRESIESKSIPTVLDLLGEQDPTLVSEVERIAGLWKQSEQPVPAIKTVPA